MSAPGILEMVHQVRLMMFSLKMVDYSMSMGGPRLLCQPLSPIGFFGVRLGWDWGLKGWGLVLDNIHESILLNYSLQKLSVNLLNIKVLTGMVLPRSITNLRGKR